MRTIDLSAQADEGGGPERANIEEYGLARCNPNAPGEKDYFQSWRWNRAWVEYIWDNLISMEIRIEIERADKLPEECLSRSLYHRLYKEFLAPESTPPTLADLFWPR